MQEQDLKAKPQPPVTNAPVQARTDSTLSMLRRAVELWPYLFIAVSITGLVYISLNAPR